MSASARTYRVAGGDEQRCVTLGFNAARSPRSASTAGRSTSSRRRCCARSTARSRDVAARAGRALPDPARRQRARVLCRQRHQGVRRTCGEDASEHKILFEDMVLRRLRACRCRRLPPSTAPRSAAASSLRSPATCASAGRASRSDCPESRLGGLAGNGCRASDASDRACARQGDALHGRNDRPTQALGVGAREPGRRRGSALDGARELASTIAARGPLSNRLAKKLVGRGAGCPARRRSFDVDASRSSRSSTATICTKASPRSSRSATRSSRGDERTRPWKRSRQTKRHD